MCNKAFYIVISFGKQEGFLDSDVKPLQYLR